MSVTQTYKIVTFQTAEASIAADSALVVYREYVKKNLGDAKASGRLHMVDYWTGRLDSINAAVTDYNAGVLA